MRLIDADELILNLKETNPHTSKRMWARIVASCAPTVAIPKEQLTKPETTEFVPSATDYEWKKCKRCSDMGKDIAYNQKLLDLWKYCPHCGAEIKKKNRKRKVKGR